MDSLWCGTTLWLAPNSSALFCFKSLIRADVATTLLSRLCPDWQPRARSHLIVVGWPALRICRSGSDASFGQRRVSVLVISDVL